jgi:hypothetical protein
MYLLFGVFVSWLCNVLLLLQLQQLTYEHHSCFGELETSTVGQHVLVYCHQSCAQLVVKLSYYPSLGGICDNLHP